jgi:hypothetical protein
VAKIANVLAPEDRSFAICDWTSGAVASNGSAATTRAFDRCMPFFNPFSRSFP